MPKEDVKLFSKPRLIFLVKSQTDKGAYHIAQYKRRHKMWHCSCDSYKFQNSKEYGCKHIKDVLEWIKYNKINLE